MSGTSSLELRFSDRKKECGLFSQILCCQTSIRGLIMHSEGKGAVGKSTLLMMFQDMCGVSDLSVPSYPLYFTAARLVKWQTILDASVDALGHAFFRKFTALRKAYDTAIKRGPITPRAGSGPTHIHQETHFHSPVTGPLHAGSGNIEMGKPESVTPDAARLSSSEYPTEPVMSYDQIREYLTTVFLQELVRIPDPLQIVWLVDTAEMLGEEEKAWLTEMFWQIVEGKADRLVLVVAGKEKLRCEPQWMAKVKEMPVSNFTEDIIVEILLDIWPADTDTRLHRGLARQLVDKCDGRPLEVRMEIESILGVEGEAYV